MVKRGEMSATSRATSVSVGIYTDFVQEKCVQTVFRESTGSTDEAKEISVKISGYRKRIYSGRSEGM